MDAIEMQHALSDPAVVFQDPEAVVRHPSLTLEQKIRILRNWKLDASRLVESEGEGMMGQDAPMLHRVGVALEALTAEG
jgi:hypothetical protein